MNNITDIEIYKKNAGKIRGNGTFVVSGMFKISFNVVEGSKGLFVSLPQEKYTDKEGQTKYAPRVSVPDKDTYSELQKTILAAFEKAGSRERKSKEEPKQENLPSTDAQDVDPDGLPF